MASLSAKFFVELQTNILQANKPTLSCMQSVYESNNDGQDFQQAREQVRFWKRFSAMDHIYVVSKLIENSPVFNKTLSVAFIGCTKTLYSVNTATVFEALKDHGIGETYIELLYVLCKGCLGRIILCNKAKSSLSEIEYDRRYLARTVRNMSDGAFLTLEWRSTGLRINEEYISSLRIVNDIAFPSEYAEHVQKVIEELHSERLAVGLQIDMNNS